MNKSFFLNLLLFMLSLSVNGQSVIKKEKQLSTEIDNYIKVEMEKRQIPGLVYGICEDENLIEVASYGYADLQNLGPVQNNTVFELASITKQFTAGAIMLLVQDGNLRLTDPINLYIENCPATWNEITIKHLLTHTSGLPAMGKGNTGALSLSPMEYIQTISTQNITKQVAYAVVKTDTLDFQPGDRYSYSDTGYFLLGFIIDNISGSYREFIQNRIFDPVGMKSSYILDRISVNKFEARGYTLRNGEIVNIQRSQDHEIPSHFGIFSNIEDLQKWDNVLNSNTLFTNESKILMWKDTKLNDGSFTGYGFGWKVKELNKKLIVWHQGVTGTEIIKFVDDKFTVIVLTNLGNGRFDRVNSWGIAQGIAEILEHGIKDD
jgi:CubicO group peptidase (beta-lactamase class C family)